MLPVSRSLKIAQKVRLLALDFGLDQQRAIVREKRKAVDERKEFLELAKSIYNMAFGKKIFCPRRKMVKTSRISRSRQTSLKLPVKS